MKLSTIHALVIGAALAVPVGVAAQTTAPKDTKTAAGKPSPTANKPAPKERTKKPGSHKRASKRPSHSNTGSTTPK